MNSPQSQLEKEQNRFSCQLSKQLQTSVNAEITEWTKSGKLKAEWKKDASVWTNSGEEKWLGWLDISEREIKDSEKLEEFANEIRDAGIKQVVLLGMGGSSLCAEVMEKSFGQEGIKNGFPMFHILDSTHPIQIKDLERNLSIKQTLFIVSSKSGSTLEPNILFEYFLKRVKDQVGEELTGRHFIAITDPGSSLEAKAKVHKFRRVFHGDPAIGGRYSILSNFGMVPAALMGVRIHELLSRTLPMVRSCSSETSPPENPGLILGAILGTLGKSGRDKVTIVCSDEIRGFGAWLEQLLAESTGKQGRGLIPIDREETLSPEGYGTDRLFVYVRLGSNSTTHLDSKINELERAGQPVVTISVSDIYNLGQEFFRWEAATAIAGSILGINPFDQPDVEASKAATRDLTKQFEDEGSLPVEVPVFENENIQIFNGPARARGQGIELSDYLRAHLNQINPGDYFAILAYIPMNKADDDVLQGLRTQVLKSKKIATCVEFGPRFLHSTGQVYKGGPNSGVFLQITSDAAADLPVPGHRYTFGVVAAAEARGDLAVLVQRKRRAMRIHFRRDLASGLRSLKKEIEKAVA